MAEGLMPSHSSNPSVVLPVPIVINPTKQHKKITPNHTTTMTESSARESRVHLLPFELPPQLITADGGHPCVIKVTTWMESLDQLVEYFI